MKAATAEYSKYSRHWMGGWLNGLVGVIIFAGSLPATRVAVVDFSPAFLTGARATIAAVLGVLCLWVLRQPKPNRAELPSLMWSALGCVVGFPLLSALALQHVTSAHLMVFMGLLPLSTACFAVLRGGERPRWPFWVFSIAGALCVVAYSLAGGIKASWQGDALMLAAIVVCGLGYAEGGRVSRRLGGWQVISWSLVLALPVMLPVALWCMPLSWREVSMPAWLGLAYVSLFSMLLGFMFWYRGLAQGGIAVVGQIQLFQPFMGLGLAALLLHETVSWAMFGMSALAVLCVFGAKKYGRG